MTPAPAVRRARLRVPLLLALAATALYLFAASRRDFWAPDEPDFAQHVREMIERRDYLVPYENGRPYSEKPILFYWAMAATTPFSGGDVSPFATRIPSAVAGGFLVFGAAWLAGRRGGTKEALVAGAATAVSPIVFWQSQFLQIDALFTALVMASLLVLYRLEEEQRTAWRLLFYGLLALAVLAKGPLAVALVVLVLLARAVLARSASEILRLDPVRAALVVLALVFPWYAAAARQGGQDYAYDLIVNQNWNRFFHAFDHIKPWWFYIEAIWQDFFPFTILAVAAPFVLGREAFRARPELRFAAVVAGTALLFLSISQSKQGKYLLIAYPFATVLLAGGAAHVERAGGAALRAFRGYALFVAGALAALALALAPVARFAFPSYAWLAPYLAVPLAVGAFGSAAILARDRKRLIPGLLAIAATLGAAEAAVAAAVLPAVDTAKTGRPFFRRIAPLVAKGEPLAYFGWTYHCYPILSLHRRTEFFRQEITLARWVSETPGALVLVDRSAAANWRFPVLRRMRLVDRQPVGGDEILLYAAHE